MPEQNVPITTEQAPASSESASKPSLGRVIAAWAVHAFTISGLAWATLALFAMLDNRASVAHASPEIVNACTAQAAITRPRLGLLALSDEAGACSVVVGTFCSGTEGSCGGG